MRFSNLLTIFWDHNPTMRNKNAKINQSAYSFICNFKISLNPSIQYTLTLLCKDIGPYSTLVNNITPSIVYRSLIPTLEPYFCPPMCVCHLISSFAGIQNSLAHKHNTHSAHYSNLIGFMPHACCVYVV